MQVLETVLSHFNSWTAWEKALETRGLKKYCYVYSPLDRPALRASSPERVSVTVGEWIGFHYMAAKLGPEGLKSFLLSPWTRSHTFQLETCLCSLTNMAATWQKEVDWIEQPIVFLHAPKFEARLFWSPSSWWDHLRHHSFGFTVWRLWIQYKQTNR